LKHVAQYSPLISENIKKAIGTPGGPVKQRFSPQDLPLSELPQYLDAASSSTFRYTQSGVLAKMSEY